MPRINNVKTIYEEMVLFKKWCVERNLSPSHADSLELFFKDYQSRESSSSTQKYYDMLVFEIVHSNMSAPQVQTTIGILDKLIESID